MNDLRHDAAAQVSRAAGLHGTSLEMSLRYAERHDQEAADATTHARLKPAPVTQPAHVLTPAQLRTVPAPNLRCPDCRTADDKVRAELVRVVDALQGLTLRVEVLEGDAEVTAQAWEIAKLRCYTEALELMLSPEQRALAAAEATAALEQHNPPAWVIP